MRKEYHGEKAMLKKINIKNFSVKFVDIMIGIVLGLGFQWWVALKEPWQFVAFVFAYLDIVDYWIDYGPALKKFPPKREIDVFLDVAICFSLFLYIYATQLHVIYFLLAFASIKLLDFFWLVSSKRSYRPTGFDRTYINTWAIVDGVEVTMAISLAFFASLVPAPALAVVLAFILMRVAARIVASAKYGKVYLAN